MVFYFSFFAVKSSEHGMHTIITCTTSLALSENATCTSLITFSPLSLYTVRFPPNPPQSCSETISQSRHVWCTWFSLLGILSVCFQMQEDNTCWPPLIRSSSLTAE
ncbi:hypothetical protein CHARACLAT_018842 [Characodon lateralis]|uniref:Uncharacterized protein n=1 Tax=Characodon lateralis TaxID=208331 RepID=A0ABU7F5F8_9TELE|nr:hypothetical protein [Characodon lateralis]